MIDHVHVEAAARLRPAFQQARDIEDPLTRDLAVYDRAFGIDLDGQVA